MKAPAAVLSFVYGFVKQSRLHMTIYSDAVQRTTISLYFPALANAGCSATAFVNPKNSQTRIGVGQLVVVVKNEARVMQLSVAQLTSFGFRCITVTTGTRLGKSWRIATTSHWFSPLDMSGHDLEK